MRFPMGRSDALVAVLSFAGTVYYFQSLQTSASAGASPYPYGFGVCGLLWLPALILLMVRLTRQKPFRGDIL